MKETISILFGLLLIAFLNQEVKANEEKNSVELLCCSVHHDRNNNPNEINPGIFYFRDLTDRNFFTVGVYRNSISENSILIGAGRRWGLSENWNFRLVGGVVTGYEDRRIGPSVMPSFEYNNWLTIHAIPGVVYSLGFRVLEW